MPTYTYIESVNYNLVCCICRMPFVEPTSAMSCSHTFCKDCILQAIEITSQCPVDRLLVTKADLRPANHIVRNLVDELLVECPKRLLGCSHTCQRHLLESHLREECKFVRVQCSEKQCSISVLRKDSGKHSEDCVHRLLECEGCGVILSCLELQTHRAECPAEETTCPHCDLALARNEVWSHSSLCPELKIKCSHLCYGCSWSGPRKQLSSHLCQCPYEQLKDFMTSNSARILKLEAENNVLRETLESLENILRTMRQDMQQTKVVLGPWFSNRLEGTQLFGPPSLPTEPPPPRSYSHGILGPSSSIISNSGTPSVTASSNVEHAGVTPTTSPPDIPSSSDTLAQYFPPEGPISPEASGRNFDSGSSPNSSVAPLNLNTTLEGTLASLRNSLVTLAATVESEIRRHDIALTTETLRVNEEIMALRAVVHGLRMQVHQIMVDRNSQVRSLEEDVTNPMYSHHRPPIPPETWPSARYLSLYPQLNRPPNPNLMTHLQATKL